MSYINPAEALGRYGRKDAGPAQPTEADLTDAIKSFKKATDDVKQFGEDMQREMKNLGGASAETKARVDEALLKFGDLQGTVTELSQKLARRGSESQPTGGKSLGQMVIESDRFKSGEFNSSSRMSLRVQASRKDIMNVTGTVGSGASPSNSLVPADRRPGLITPPMRHMTVRDLLMPGETASNAIEYPVETGFTNNAAPVAEGAQKPKSDITFDLKSAPVRTIAHLFKASRQILDDAPQLRSYIDGRARYGLELKEEGELLMGDGTGQHILGLVPQAAAFAPAAAATPTAPTGIDRLRLAILQVVLAEYPASGFVLNPIDWAGIELTKDTTGQYIIGNPQNGTARTLWNLPVVETISMTQNTFLCGAFNMGAQVFDRMEIEVLLSTENVDDFEKNMVTLRAEERLALAVYRPEAFVTGEVVDTTP